MNQYRIHAKDDGESVTKLFEADSGAEARRMAEAIGLTVLAVEVVSSATTAPPFRDGGFDGPSSESSATTDPRDVPEAGVWQGSPSQWTNFWWLTISLLSSAAVAALSLLTAQLYLFVLVLAPVAWGTWKAISTAKQNYAVTSQRLTLETGVFKRNLEEIELYRIKDTRLTRTFVQRLLGLGTVTVISSDESSPTLVIPWIKGSVEVRQLLRENVELVRRARGVRELDMN